MSKYQHDKLYPYVVLQQGGEYCVGCDRNKQDLSNAGQVAKFVIDVSDNSHNHTLANLRMMQLMCISCNTKKNHWRNTEPHSRTATPEFMANRTFEPAFRKWVRGHYQEKANIGLTYDYVINSGAEFVGCSTKAIKSYLDKMTSTLGEYEWDNRTTTSLLVLKKEFKYEPEEE